MPDDELKTWFLLRCLRWKMGRLSKQCYFIENVFLDFQNPILRYRDGFVFAPYRFSY